MEWVTEALGYAGMVTGVSFMVPQVYKSYKTKSVEDLSWGMLALLYLNTVFWFLYGILLGAVPLLLTNGIALVTNTVLITLKVRYRNNP